MAVINNSLQLNDRMTPVLRSIIKALNSTMEAMASVDQVGQQSFRNTQRAIQQASQAVENFGGAVTENTTESANVVDMLVDKVKKLGAAFLSIQGVKFLVNLSDQMASLNAATDIINSGQRETLNLQEKIRQSALATGSNYMDVANNVKNLAMMAGNAFSSNDEILYFSEQLNKQFAIAGVNGAQAGSVMYNLTQALSSGVLRGNDFNILASNMGNFIDGIAKTMGVSRSQMKQMAEEGKITADMVKKAMYDMAEETNARFASMPLQWTNIWNNMQTKMLQALQPLLDKISQIFNSQKFATFIAGVTTAIMTAIGILTGLFNIIASVGEFIYDKWLLIEPILWSIGAYGVSVLIPMIWAMAKSAWAMVPPLWASATAWLALNWPILVIGLAIGVVIALFKHFGVTAEDVIGRIVGSAYWLGQVFQNVWSGIRNGWWTLVGAILKGVKALLEKLNFNGAFDDAIASVDKGIENASTKKAKAQGDWGDLSTAYEKGNTAGRKAATDIKSKFSGATSSATEFARFNADNANLDAITKNTSQTAGNTSKLADGVNLSDEDIELLKESARISFVNRFTTMTPNITATFGDVHETADVKGIMGQIEKSVMDALESSLT